MNKEQKNRREQIASNFPFASLNVFLVAIFLGLAPLVYADSGKPNDFPTATSETCGGPEKKICPSQTYCEFPEGSCGKDASFGKCNPMPEICSMEFAPICGCDEKTYGNRCMAKSKGISIAHEGDCGTAPKKP